MLKLLKEIRAKNGELHFRRWNIFSTKWFSLYLHCIYKKDDDQHPHNHPWNFWSLILRGGYLEMLYNKKDRFSQRRFHRSIFSLAYRKKEDYHQVIDIDDNKPVWTLVLTGRRNIEWGYLVEKEHINNEKYRQLKNSSLFTSG